MSLIDNWKRLKDDDILHYQKYLHYYVNYEPPGKKQEMDEIEDKQNTNNMSIWEELDEAEVVQNEEDMEQLEEPDESQRLEDDKVEVVKNVGTSDEKQVSKGFREAAYI